MWLFPEEVSSATEAWVFSTNAASTTAGAFKKYFGILKEIKPEVKALKTAESKQDWKAAKESATKCAEILHQAATELKNTKVGTIGAAIVNLTLATIPAVIQTAVTNTLLEKQSERFSKKMEKRYYDEGKRIHEASRPITEENIKNLFAAEHQRDEAIAKLTEKYNQMYTSNDPDKVTECGNILKEIQRERDKFKAASKLYHEASDANMKVHDDFYKKTLDDNRKLEDANNRKNNIVRGAVMGGSGLEIAIALLATINKRRKVGSDVQDITMTTADTNAIIALLIRMLESEAKNYEKRAKRADLMMSGATESWLF